VLDVPVREGRITLGQLLKLAGTVDRGSDVRPFLQAGGVTVNGAHEDRRGRKLVEGDIVEAPGAEPMRVTVEVPEA
jgi:ribosome-associated protein